MSRVNLAKKVLENETAKFLEVERIVTDRETGEIIKETNRKVYEPTFRFKNGNGIGMQSRYSKSFHTVDLELSKATYYKYFHYMERRLEQGTNRVVIHTDVNSPNTPVNDHLLSKIADANIRTIRNFLKECIEKNYIAKLDKNDEFFGYMVNPMYSMNGNKLNVFLYVLFSDEEFNSHIPKEDLIKVKCYLSDTKEIIK